MYEFQYNYIWVKYGSGAKLLLLTDNLVYETETDDIYEDFYEDRSLYDFNNYSKDSRFYDPVNRKVIGKIQEKVWGSIINAFVGLKSKMYPLVMRDGGKVKK